MEGNSTTGTRLGFSFSELKLFDFDCVCLDML